MHPSNEKRGTNVNQFLTWLVNTIDDKRERSLIASRSFTFLFCIPRAAIDKKMNNFYLKNGILCHLLIVNTVDYIPGNYLDIVYVQLIRIQWIIRDFENNWPQTQSIDRTVKHITIILIRFLKRLLKHNYLSTILVPQPLF